MEHREAESSATPTLDARQPAAARPMSPLHLLLITVGVVFVAELLSMVGLEALWGVPEAVEAGIDILVLSLVVVPLLYLSLYRPLNRYVAQLEGTTEALRYSEEKYQTLVEHSPVGIFIHRGGRIVFANRRMYSMFTCAASTLVDADPFGLVIPEDRERLAALLDPPRGDAAPPEIELRALTPDGNPRWLIARSTRIPYREGESILGTVVDITPRKRLEEELRRLSMQRLEVQEEERGRLARELHDGVGQSLSAFKFLVEHALGQPHAGERRQQMELLQELIPKIQETIEDVRRMSMALRPSTLDDLGLLATIRWFLGEVQGTCPHLELHHRLQVAEAQVPDPLKITIYRTVQEAVNNVAKHCGACRVEVVLELRDGCLCLEVADDGKGFDPADLLYRQPEVRGLGLGNMEERVQLSGGRFDLFARPGQGARVRATWPLPAAETSVA